MLWKTPSLSSILMLLLATSVFGSDKIVHRIEIKSYWAGLGTPQKSELVIRNSGGRFRLGRKKIDSARVEALVAALEEDPVPQPSLENLAITKNWLEKQLAIIPSALSSGKLQNCSPRQQALFRDSFTSRDFQQSVIPSLFNYTKFDDYRSARIIVTFEDGSSISASTTSSYLLMIPWEVSSGSTRVSTYNAHISRALASLLPKNTTNLQELAGDGLGVDLAEATMRRIENDWNLSGVEEKAGATIALLRTEYLVKTADINSYHDVAFGKKWDKGAIHQENFHASVVRPSFPPHFNEAVILPYEGGKVSGLEDFLKNAKRYEDLALSVPWLAAWREKYEKYPYWKISVLWVHDKSLGDKAMANFVADMHALGKDSLADEVRREQQSAALLNIGYGNYWIVLPDRRMVLWRYESVTGLLGLKQSEISVRRCTDYRAVTGGCIGAVVSPEGNLQK